MSNDEITQVRELVDAVYRAESRRVLATLIRLLGDFDAAEEALHEAFAVAVERWAQGWRPGQSAGLARVDRPLQGYRWHAAADQIRRLTPGTLQAAGIRIW